MCLYLIVIFFILFLPITIVKINFWSWNYILCCSSPVLLPFKTYINFSNSEEIKADLKKVGGVYEFFNLKNGKQYIGSSSNLYERFTDHVKRVS